ncbi:vacuolar protein sorting-associated protein [Corchorus olitorius]|uniref:Vacuolar protein sorting-associated protein n=1 Tax=Corchorus olitorius TaxID=93759 RepID=A0A1R3I8J8_9ROSI|nr:vacuolar protein sorting-associated protein [Corchorus olitorius]
MEGSMSRCVRNISLAFFIDFGWIRPRSGVLPRYGLLSLFRCLNDFYPLLKLKMAARHAEKQIPLEPHWGFCFSHGPVSPSIACTVGHLSKSVEVMKLVNNLMKAPEVAVTMQEFNKEMTKENQVMALKEKGIAAEFLSST